MDPSEAASIVVAALSSRGTGNDALRDSSEALSMLADGEQLLGVIGAIRDDPEAVRRCAAQSLRHPLGHDKIMLIDTDASFRLRIHAWWPSRRPGAEHVHHHRFGLATTVLRGQYEMQIFQRAKSGLEMIEYRQYASTDSEEWYLHPAGIAHLRLLTTARVVAGGGYTLTPDALHRVIVPRDGVCLTLFLAVVANVDLSAETRVFASPESAVPALVNSPAFTADDYRRRLDAIIVELAGTG